MIPRRGWWYKTAFDSPWGSNSSANAQSKFVVDSGEWSETTTRWQMATLLRRERPAVVELGAKGAGEKKVYENGPDREEVCRAWMPIGGMVT
jgi:hypothetical protein